MYLIELVSHPPIQTRHVENSTFLVLRHDSNQILESSFMVNFTEGTDLLYKSESMSKVVIQFTDNFS